MRLVIRNMVCDRCRLAVSKVLDDMGIVPVHVRLGEVELGDRNLDAEELETFRTNIETLGFELISDKRSRLVEEIKKHLIANVQEPSNLGDLKISEYLSRALFHDYGYLSNLFSSVEGVTIERYFIHLKIEKVKELLVYDESTLTEIAFNLGYSSVAHLSRQFKKVTGLTPTEFKRLHSRHPRRPLDKV